MGLINARPTKRLCTGASGTPHKLDVVCGATYIPKKSGTLGEDSHFICNKAGTTIFGVADGVGGWASRNINAGNYARQLMFNSLISIYSTPEASLLDPKAILTEGYNSTTAAGSSTACILTVNGDNLHVANVGDSGFMIFRGGVCAYTSPVQQHRFNSPYQLGNSAGCNRPKDAQEFKIRVAPGDIIVAGTDGLLDNLFVWEIEEFLATHKDLLCQPAEMARLLAEVALENSKEREIFSPFSIAALKAGLKYNGGKIDDITVIVSCICAP